MRDEGRGPTAWIRVSSNLAVDIALDGYTCVDSGVRSCIVLCSRSGAFVPHAFRAQHVLFASPSRHLLYPSSCPHIPSPRLLRPQGPVRFLPSLDLDGAYAPGAIMGVRAGAGACAFTGLVFGISIIVLSLRCFSIINSVQLCALLLCPRQPRTRTPIDLCTALLRFSHALLVLGHRRFPHSVLRACDQLSTSRFRLQLRLGALLRTPALS